MKVLGNATVIKIELNRSEMLHVNNCLPNGFIYRITNDRNLIDPFIERLFKFGEHELVEFFVNRQFFGVDEFIFIEE
jgi:hypothetical protein